MGLEEKVKKVGVILVSSDYHVKYHSRKALRTFLKISEYLDDRLKAQVINGDLLDCYAISKFSKDPKRLLTFQEELDQAKVVLEKIKDRSNPKAEFIFNEGNHEVRFDYLKTTVPALASLRDFSIPELMGLKDLGYRFNKLGKPYKRKDYMIYHGNLARKHSGYSAKGELDDNCFSGITGHTHRGGIHYKTTRVGTLMHAEGFCMCQPRAGDDYIKGVKNWQQGFLAIYEHGTSVEVVPVRVRNGKAIFEGKVFKG